MTEEELKEAAQWCWAYDLNVLAYDAIAEGNTNVEATSEHTCRVTGAETNVRQGFIH